MSSTRSLRSTSIPVGSALVALFLAGCGGGGSSSDAPIQSLSMADSMSVVTINGNGSPASVAPHSQADTSGFSPDCDYNTDVAQAHVYDPSVKPLDTVNMILCLLKQTAYSGLLNVGLYRAQIDERACDSGSGESSTSGTGQSSGAAQQFNVWVIESSRPSATGAQELEFWIPSTGDGDIRCRVQITKGVSDENPFGVFDLNYVQFESDNVTLRGFGNLHTIDAASGLAGFSFYQEEGDVDVLQAQNEHADRVQANVQMSADQTSGSARILLSHRETLTGGFDTGIVSAQYNLVFDETHMLRETNNDGGVCLSRTDFDTRTWRYNLYDSQTGERVELFSGFGFQTQAGHYGWAGYHGVWLPNDEDLPDGATITRDTYGQSTPQTYTLLKARGKLIQNTRRTLPLTEIGGMQFEWWYGYDDMGTWTVDRNLIEYQSPDWVIVKRWNDGTQSWDDLSSPLTVATSSLGAVGMWSPALGGSCSFVHGDTSITYYEREVVGPTHPLLASHTDVDLYGFYNCLRAGISSSEATAGDIYLADSHDVMTPYVYTLHPGDMTFTIDVASTPTEVGLGDAQAPTGGPYTWGMSTGALVTADVLATLADTASIYNASVFYTYETGPNPWNQFTALYDANEDPVVFDKPIQFSYTHHTGDDANADPTYDGRTYLLGFDGPGQLGGIPHVGVDLNDDATPDRWYPEFSIKAGTLCGPTGTEYVIRPIDSEETLSADTGNCTALTSGLAGAAGLSLPTSADWTDPNLGTMPTVTDAPRAVRGTVVGVGP